MVWGFLYGTSPLWESAVLADMFAPGAREAQWAAKRVKEFLGGFGLQGKYEASSPESKFCRLAAYEDKSTQYVTVPAWTMQLTRCHVAIAMMLVLVQHSSHFRAMQQICELLYLKVRQCAVQALAPSKSSGSGATTGSNPAKSRRRNAHDMATAEHTEKLRINDVNL